MITHPVVGFRAWSPIEGGILKGSYSPYVWKPGDNEALCFRRDMYAKEPHRVEAGGLYVHTERPSRNVPSLTCTCGFYANHQLVDAQNAHAASIKRVYGIVKGWGRILVHPDGWRSPYAEIQAIFTGHEKSAAAAAYYRVPLLQLPETPAQSEAMISEYGKLVPVDARPQREADKF